MGVLVGVTGVGVLVGGCVSVGTGVSVGVSVTVKVGFGVLVGVAVGSVRDKRLLAEQANMAAITARPTTATTTLFFIPVINPPILFTRRGNTVLR
jgi:hypothetical protein